jgi:hypothetical protein
MNWLRTALCTALLAARVVAQTGLATVTGTVADPNGSAVALAVVQLRNAETGTTYKATTSATGTYVIPNVPTGTYDLVIPAIGFMFDRYEQKSVPVVALSHRLDIHLPWGGNLGTPGDDTSLLIRSKGSAVGPAPRTSEGKPDFTGVWLGSRDPDPTDPALLPWAKSLVDARLANAAKDHPSGFCLPGDVIPFASPVLRKIVQTPTLILRLTEGDVPGLQQIFLDGRGHKNDPNPTWLGHSVARWEGETLIVDTVGYNDKSWLDIYPHTEMLHLVERWRRPDLGHLEIDFTIEDRGTFTEPWTIHNVWDLAPSEDLMEYVCENNKDAEHLSKL